MNGLTTSGEPENFIPELISIIRTGSADRTRPVQRAAFDGIAYGRSRVSSRIQMLRKRTGWL